MAVILQMTYYCSLGLTTEIQDKEMAGEESTKLRQLLQSAVDKEIQAVGWMPESTTACPKALTK